MTSSVTRGRAPAESGAINFARTTCGVKKNLGLQRENVIIPIKIILDNWHEVYWVNMSQFRPDWSLKTCRWTSDLNDQLVQDTLEAAHAHFEVKPSDILGLVFIANKAFVQWADSKLAEPEGESRGERGVVSPPPQSSRVNGRSAGTSGAKLWSLAPAPSVPSDMIPHRQNEIRANKSSSQC